MVCRSTNVRVDTELLHEKAVSRLCCSLSELMDQPLLLDVYISTQGVVDSFLDLVIFVRQLLCDKLQETKDDHHASELMKELIRLNFSILQAVSNTFSCRFARHQVSTILKFFGHNDPDANFIFLSRMERTQMETFLCDLLRRWVATREAGRYSLLCEMSPFTLRYDYIMNGTSLEFTRRAVNILKPVFVFRGDKVYDHRRNYKNQEAIMLRLILGNLSNEHIAYSAVLEFLQEFGSIILDACTSSSVAVSSTFGYYSALHELELADIAEIVQSVVNWWVDPEKRFPLEPLIPVARWVLQMLERPNTFHVTDWQDIPSRLVTLPLRFGVSAGAILHLLSANPRPCSKENQRPQ